MPCNALWYITDTWPTVFTLHSHSAMQFANKAGVSVLGSMRCLTLGANAHCLRRIRGYRVTIAARNNVSLCSHASVQNAMLALQDVNIVEALAGGLASLAVMGSPPRS